MNRYVAFLRAINVGGKNMIKMEELIVLFQKCGLSNIKTYINSGNLLFDSEESDLVLLQNKIESLLEISMGKKITVLIRTKKEIEQLIAKDPFKEHPYGTNTKLYICFLDRKPELNFSFPLRHDKEALILTGIEENDGILVSLPKEDEHFGFPNPFIEKKLKVLSTARNWNTVLKIGELLKK